MDCEECHRLQRLESVVFADRPETALLRGRGTVALSLSERI